MEWQKKVFIAFVSLVVSYLTPLYIQTLGVQEDVYAHEPGECTFLEGIDRGAEDIVTMTDGLTFISSGMAKHYNHTSRSRGTIYLFDMNKPSSKPEPLQLVGIDEDAFIPHGISVYKNKTTGLITLFVVNHNPQQDRIEKFHFDRERKSLTLVMSYYDNRLTQANDVAAISENEFYYTNYLYAVNSVLRTLEIYMPMRWGSVFFWQTGSRPVLVARRLKQPNGIAVSPDNKLLYLSHEGNHELRIYARHENNSLELLQNFYLNTPLDNLFLSHDGKRLYVGSHAVFWKIYKQLTDPDYPAPSHVLKLDLENGVNVTRVTEVYANDGSELKGCSVATYYKGKLLVGTVLHRAMLCDMHVLSKRMID